MPGARRRPTAVPSPGRGDSAFIRARHEELAETTNPDNPDWLKAERDLTAKQARLKFMELVLSGPDLEAGERIHIEHLLSLEAAAYDWHADFRDEWRP
ncbi:hypothetical protein [Microtetraspora malaysiensis]|uniref:hypothetical protein n=1 Tax=Microtetraspora malaysiensis TaxID=161358 RepID=UPI003D8E3E23